MMTTLREKKKKKVKHKQTKLVPHPSLQLHSFDNYYSTVCSFCWKLSIPIENLQNLSFFKDQAEPGLDD